MKCFGKAAIAAATLAMCGTTASATPYMIDRGLPTTNLNNAAGSNRSNVAWGFEGNYMSGDTFTLPSSSRIDKLSIWVVAGSADPGTTLQDTFSSISFYLGSASDSSVPLAMSANLTGNLSDNPNVAVSRVTYADGQDYQNQNSGFNSIFQIDFLNLGNFAAGDFVFALGGQPMNGANPFLHASNADLSGSSQDGANDLYNWFYGAPGDASVLLGGDYQSNGVGWDKSSDINVQIMAVVIPLPGAAGMALAGMGLIGLRRRR